MLTSLFLSQYWKTQHITQWEAEVNSLNYRNHGSTTKPANGRLRKALWERITYHYASHHALGWTDLGVAWCLLLPSQFLVSFQQQACSHLEQTKESFERLRMALDVAQQRVLLLNTEPSFTTIILRKLWCLIFTWKVIWEERGIGEEKWNPEHRTSEIFWEPFSFGTTTQISALSTLSINWRRAKHQPWEYGYTYSKAISQFL